MKQRGSFSIVTACIVALVGAMVISSAQAGEAGKAVGRFIRGQGEDAVIETQLDLKSGRILGIIKKMAHDSKYEIKTPNGVAGIRGTEYDITATSVVRVITGSLVVVYVKNDGTVVTQVVNAGEMFVPSEGAVRSEEHTSELQSQSNLVCRLL